MLHLHQEGRDTTKQTEVIYFQQELLICQHDQQHMQKKIKGNGLYANEVEKFHDY